jgi:hypothetical protein
MNGGQAVTLPWGDGERVFHLKIGGWRRVQTVCDAGPEEIAARLSPTVDGLRRNLSLGEAALRGLVGRWRYDDVREVIYQALLGGGEPLPSVAKLIAELVDDRPIRENVPLAFAIVMASLDGVPDDPLSTGEGEATESGLPAEKSASPSSTDAAAAPVSRRRKSTK